MNIHFSQVENRSQLSSYLLAAFAISVVLMLALSFNQYFAHHWSLSSASSDVVSAESATTPVAIPAPLPPAEQIQVSMQPSPASANPVPQVVPVPVPSVP